MRCQSIAYGRLPHPSKLFLHYIEEFSRVSGFYAHAPNFAAVKRVAGKRAFPLERRREVAAILREQNRALGCGAATERNLERLEKGAVAIVTGQQVGLFSGPAYAVYKALTAVAVAEELTRAGVEAVPVFWMATEDHDFEEVRQAQWWRNGGLETFALPAAPKEGVPAGSVALGGEIAEMVRRAADALEGSDSGRIAEILKSSYAPGETCGSAFGKLYARLFEEEGLILLDPLDGRLHKLAAPVFRQAIAECGILREKLLERGKKLEQAGYAAQVKVTGRSTLLFQLEGGVRRAVTEGNGGFQAGEKIWTREEFLRVAETGAEVLSANALLRPVMQDFLLPTAAYIAGPGEIAYYAQAEVVYRQILGWMPVVLPRADFTVVDGKAEKLLKKYGLKVEEIWDGREKIRRKMELQKIPATLGARMEEGYREAQRALERLRGPLGKLDVTLLGALERAKKSSAYHYEKLKNKAGRARALREGVIAGHEEYLCALLFPRRGMQSRELCLLPMMALWGPEALRELKKYAGSKGLGAHQVIYRG
ncbi:MAG: bacillithiol biosynthesis cysteine-adding enzyme BshC [Acidobacteriia bacterium]|nr:bacillithiol biosynthesis cysteine-adding enzyme BshC [Terriglobia bacterium]